ncbi:unnamed protein product (macronuclear) [Paramecium tetraurelia]|uniref:Transmembrane protein n=1 Tax=Paramecium tetraurelia TaxID=5888 RepID=A0BER5_PARTE|nr:uncharacterized protein GSPATT00028065001 [Paramecium tetraurelia]CAK57032.1 unnamed protein product [Paramecium tetraurelia]|eukprot:XP_001424430.1 hypothetical protein (macronuclear) [Paramecium tetraurelia strain d4-2]
MFKMGWEYIITQFGLVFNNKCIAFISESNNIFILGILKVIKNQLNIFNNSRIQFLKSSKIQMINLGIFVDVLSKKFGTPFFILFAFFQDIPKSSQYIFCKLKKLLKYLIIYAPFAHINIQQQNNKLNLSKREHNIHVLSLF